MRTGERGYRRMKAAVASANKDHAEDVRQTQADWDNEVKLAAELREDRNWRIERRQHKLRKRQEKLKKQGRW